LENINLFLKKKKREKYKIKLIQSNGDYYRILGFSQDIINRKKPFGGKKSNMTADDIPFQAIRR